MQFELNMVYYKNRLINSTSKLCTIILLWVKYNKNIPIGVSKYLEIFQEKMNEILQCFNLIQEYINDLLLLTTGD